MKTARAAPPMIQRAYSMLTIKSINEDAREIIGIASTPEADRMGDIVEPKGAEYNLPIPLLWQHDPSQPIGEVYAARATASGIEIKARVKKAPEPGRLADRLDEAWQSLKIGLVKGLSIGFQPIEYAFMDTGGIHFMKWDWLELSAVTIPANASSTITAIKSLDRKALAASGKQVPALAPSAVAAKTRKHTAPKEGKAMDYAEQIKALEAEHKTLLATMKNFTDGDGEVEADNEKDYNAAEENMKQVAKKIKRLKTLHDAEQNGAIDGARLDTQEKAAGFRAAAPAIVKRTEAEQAFKGQNFARGIIAKALAHKQQTSPSAIAHARWGKSNPGLVQVIKANEINVGGEASGAWGAELVQVNNQYTGDFIELLRAATVYDKLALRPAPVNVLIKGQATGGSGYFIGEGKAIKASNPTFTDDVTLTRKKVAAITSVSNELLKDSSPSAEQMILDSLVKDLAQAIDVNFLSNDTATGALPAGLRKDLNALHTAGNDETAILEDIAALYAPFLTALHSTGLVFVMNPARAKKLSLMRNALGQKVFPDITAQGGKLEGDMVVTGDNVNASYVYLIDPAQIYKIGDTGVEISISDQATLEMSSAPTGSGLDHTAASANLQNMFQEDSTAIKVVRPFNHQKRRSTAAQWMDDAAWGEAAS